jgi:hypothetical protein
MITGMQPCLIPPKVVVCKHGNELTHLRMTVLRVKLSMKAPDQVFDMQYPIFHEPKLKIN